MKLILATLVPLVSAAFFISPAIADETHPAALGTTVTVQVVSSKPPASVDDSEEAKQRDLEACGAKWNAKLKAYRKELERTEAYRTYFDTWKESAAQRPPQLPIPVLTRASYRQCMAQCLEGEGGAICPGGWPEAKK